ncbi:pfkB carbohydrate kinase family protein [Paraburkholderia xenovorans LB400]|uniref:Ribokinase n=1 Tax=Paraburkholderia xenovorans (strain LB400) TaxID=266265 RepID=Q13FJ7_PARXL|nr:ribokinase [Paraburkholderia xenovorans]ABE37142.1 putative ribokinase [Paraburkholderia xenovorans LB400]AIP33968.1 pfkB carbohydrate kinase family protein [Paraburkholderia xenovorans LB400]
MLSPVGGHRSRVLPASGTIGPSTFHALCMGTIVSIGSINLDLQMRVDHPVGSAETQRAHDFSRLAGGKAANVAYLARRFGHDAQLLGMVGDDRFADEAVAPLRDLGIDVSRVRTAAGQPTAVSMIFVPDNGKKTIVLASNANDAWQRADIDAALEAIDAAPAHSVLAVDCEMSVDACAAVLAAAQRRALCVVLDPAPPQRAQSGALRALWRAVHALTPNEEEAAALTGIEIADQAGAVRAARALHREGFELVCVKRSDGGCIAVSRDGVLAVQVKPVEALDTTGAGDAFTGALAVSLVERRAFADAVRLATAAANLTVMAWGSQTALPDRARADAFAAGLQCEWL